MYIYKSINQTKPKQYKTIGIMKTNQVRFFWIHYWNDNKQQREIKLHGHMLMPYMASDYNGFAKVQEYAIGHIMPI